MLKIVFKNELIKNFKNKKKLVLNFLLPIIAIVLALLVNHLMKPSLNVGVISNNKISDSFIERINKIEDINSSYSSKESSNADIILGKYDVIVDIENKDDISVMCNDENMTEDISDILDEYINNGDIEGFRRLLDNKSNGQLSLEDRTISFMFIIILIMATLLNSNIFVDKKSGVLKRYFLSPNKLWIYLFGVYLYYFLFSFVQCLIVSILIKILPIGIYISFINLTFLSLIISAISSSIGYLLIILCNNEMISGILASSIAIIIALIGGAFLPLSKMPKLLVVMSDYSIVKWLINFSDVKNIVAIVITTLLCVIIATVVGKRRIFSI